MKCLSCDNVLTARESVRRVASTKEFLDLCDACYAPIKQDVPTIERVDDGLIEDEEQVDE